MPLTLDDITTVQEMMKNGKNAKAIGEHFSVTAKAVLHFVSRRRLGTWVRTNKNKRREPDQDFIDNGAKYTRGDASKKWAVGSETLTRWYRETGIKPRSKHDAAYWTQEQMREKVGGMTIAEAAVVMGVERNYASKLMRAAGLIVNKPKVSPILPDVTKPTFRRPMGAPQAPINSYTRDMSPHGRAQEILQADRWVVYRCNENGKADVAGKFWFCGSRVITGQELLERAERVARRANKPIPWRQAA